VVPDDPGGLTAIPVTIGRPSREPAEGKARSSCNSQTYDQGSAASATAPLLVVRALDAFGAGSPRRMRGRAGDDTLS
jgi:hypothetical protein